MTRMRVDFNSIVRDGLLRGSARRADGPIQVGSLVEVFDPGEPDMEYEAEVAEYEPETGRAYLRVRWEPVQARQANEWLHLRSLSPSVRGAWARPVVTLTELTVIHESTAATTWAPGEVFA